MGFGALVFRAGISRNRGQSLFVVLAMTLCMLLYTLLATVHESFVPARLSLPASHLLIVLAAKQGALPFSSWSQLSDIPGVAVVSPISNAAFYYQSPSNTIGVGVVDPHSYLALFPQLHLIGTQKRAWLRNKSGAIATLALMRHNHWHLGSTVPLLAAGSSWPKPLYVTLDGIVPPSSYNTLINGRLLVHLDYFEQWLPPNAGNFLVYALSVRPGVDPARVAREIDQRFKNSPNPTRTQPFNVFMRQWVNRIGNVGGASLIVMAICIVSIGLAIVSAAMQEFLQRTTDYALMFALGFTRRKIFVLLLAELAGLIGVGATLGIATGAGLVNYIHPEMLPYFHVSPPIVGIGALVSAAILVAVLSLQWIPLMCIRAANIRG